MPLQREGDVTEDARSIALIGFMGTGKTTIGRAVARKLGYEFVDSDHVVERHARCTIAELFAEVGVEEFRRRETEALRELAACPRLVIATGGGAVLNPENRALLREGALVVLLTADPWVILRRVGDAQTRPLLTGYPDTLARISSLLRERQPAYDLTAHVRVDSSGRSVDATATRIVEIYTRQEQRSTP